MYVVKNRFDLRWLSTKVNRRKINALLHIYDAYKDTVINHLENSINTSNKLNILFRNKLIPTIKKLAEELEIDPGSKRVTKLSTNYLPFPNLFLAEKILRDNNQSTRGGIAEIFGIYGWIKELAEDTGAVNQPTIPEIENLVWELRSLAPLGQSSDPIISLGTPPKVFLLENGWRIQGPRRVAFLSRRGSLYGEFVGLMIESWGALRTKDTVLEMLSERTRKKGWQLEHIETALKGINKIVSAVDLRRFRLIQDGDSLMLGYSDKRSKK